MIKSWSKIFKCILISCLVSADWNVVINFEILIRSFLKIYVKIGVPCQKDHNWNFFEKLEDFLVSVLIWNIAKTYELFWKFSKFEFFIF